MDCSYFKTEGMDGCPGRFASSASVQVLELPMSHLRCLVSFSMSPLRISGGVCLRFIHVCRPQDTFACDSKQRTVTDGSHQTVVDESHQTATSLQSQMVTRSTRISTVGFVCCLAVVADSTATKRLQPMTLSTVVADSTATKRLQRTVCE